MSAQAKLLHQSPWRGVFNLTGGGTGFLNEALGTAGASRTVLEVQIPYAQASLAELLGGAPDQACSAATSRALAMIAFQRARHLKPEPAFGFGLTASLATDRPKQGACRVHIAVQTLAHTSHAEVQLLGDRPAQEADLTARAWLVLLQALDLEAPSNKRINQTRAPAPWRDLVTGTSRKAYANHDGKLLFPGAFNPLHDGHRRMMAIAEARCELSGAFELSIENPDKALLDYFEIGRRLAQFDRPVWLTRLPRFADKAAAFPGTVFVVGIDTLERIADLRYYGSVVERDQALAAMLGQGVRFLVFGRLQGNVFQSLSQVDLPPNLQAACQEIGEAEFRADLSSTKLRQSGD